MQYSLSSLALALMVSQLERAIAVPRGAPICEHQPPVYSIDSQTIGPGTPVTGSAICSGVGGSKSSKQSVEFQEPCMLTQWRQNAFCLASLAIRLA